MTAGSVTAPELFWISGSAPSWRVSLALKVKGIAFVSRRLDSAKGEHKTQDFLALNPRGQVPVLRHGSLVVRESLAILAYIERQWPENAIMGATPAEAAAVWQVICDYENNLQPVLSDMARILFRRQAAARADDLAAMAPTIRRELLTIDRMLTQQSYAAGEQPTAADFVLYPGLAWLDRAITKEGRETAAGGLFDTLPRIEEWRLRLERWPYVLETYPPHWAANTPG